MFDQSVGGPLRRAQRRTRFAADVDDYYLCGCDGPRVTLLVGPFPTADAAERWREPAEGLLLGVGELELALDLRVSRWVGAAGPARPGDLNRALGIA